MWAIEYSDTYKNYFIVCPFGHRNLFYFTSCWNCSIRWIESENKMDFVYSEKYQVPQHIKLQAELLCGK